MAVVALAAVGTGGVLLAGGAGASGVHRTVKPMTVAPAAEISATNSNAAAVYRYWTPERMKAAKPLTIHLASSASSFANAGDTATGAPGVAGGTQPAGPSALQRVNNAPNSDSVSPADGGYPGPNDTFNYQGNLRRFPASTLGKLFFTEPNGNFVCSAAATYGGGTKNMVWTAGHCVGPQGGKSYYSNWLFCPSYSAGENANVGCWAWALAQQTGGWYFNGYWANDYAYLYMANTGDKKANHVVDVTGGMGFAWNWSRDQHWADFGYPSGSPYNGNYLVETNAEHRYDVNNPASGDPTPDNSIGSKQTPGFSGGPWILSFGQSNGNDPISHGNWINSDNSYYFTSGGNGNEYGTEIQGPYYDTNACNFWKSGSGWSGTC